METLFDAETRRQVQARIQEMGPDCRRHWGSMTVPQALSHMGDQLAMALGDIDAVPVRGPLSWPPLKQLVLYVLPWPKNAKTAPELLQTRIEDVEVARRRLLQLIDRFVALGDSSGDGDGFSRHPLFGSLSTRTWGSLAWRHLDHHLRQFGL